MEKATDAGEASQRLAEASGQLKLLVQQAPFPELRAPIARLATTVENIVSTRSTEADEANILLLERSVRIYRTSAAQINASPQKYQQPIFQCYSDYQKCVGHNKSKGGKALCLSMFVFRHSPKAWSPYRSPLRNSVLPNFDVSNSEQLIAMIERLAASPGGEHARPLLELLRANKGLAKNVFEMSFAFQGLDAEASKGFLDKLSLPSLPFNAVERLEALYSKLVARLSIRDPSLARVRLAVTPSMEFHAKMHLGRHGPVCCISIGLIIIVQCVVLCLVCRKRGFKKHPLLHEHLERECGLESHRIRPLRPTETNTEVRRHSRLWKAIRFSKP